LALVGQVLCQNALGNKKEALQLWHSVIDLDPQYNTVDNLVKDYHPPQEFVEATRKVVTNLKNEQSHKIEMGN
jgi:hypothetical protein